MFKREINMSKKTRNFHPFLWGVSRRGSLQMIAAVIVAAVACGMPENAAAQMDRGISQMRMSNPTSRPHPRGGHLYMQTNETRNAIMHYRWSTSGALAEVERVATGGAGSGELSPIYHVNRPNDFEGAGSVILTPDRRFLFATNAGDNSVSSFAVSEDGELTLVDTKRTGKNRLPLPPSGCAGFVGAQIAGTLGLKVEIRSVPCRVFHI